MVDTADAERLLADELLPAWQQERRRLDAIDAWARWEHPEPHRPKHATAEYRELARRAQAPWGDLIVGSIAQTLFVEGYRRPSDPDDALPWRYWQANSFDARQIAVHRAALTYGVAYVGVLPGVAPDSGEALPWMRGFSPREMLAVYEDPAVDEWPAVAVRVRKIKGGRLEVALWDDERVRYYETDDVGAKLEQVREVVHGIGECPIVRYCNRVDLEGRAAGEIEPFLSVLGRIDQTTFDRLVVQRFASWVVRTIAGMSVSETARVTGEPAERVKMRLRAEDFLVAEDPDTKFGALPATSLDGFIAAHEADVRVLAAVSQSPAHELLGSMANMSAEALAAARASQTQKADERRHVFGEAHEQLLRMAAFVAGELEAAADFEAQVRWRDTSIRSLAQAADALGKLAQMLGVPVEMLWEKIPGWTDQDVERARALVREGGIERLFDELARGLTPITEPAPPPNGVSPPGEPVPTDAAG